MLHVPERQYERIKLIIYRLKEVIFKHYVLSSRHLIHVDTLIFPWMKTRLISKILITYIFCEKEWIQFFKYSSIYATFKFNKLPFTQNLYRKKITLHIESCHVIEICHDKKNSILVEFFKLWITITFKTLSDKFIASQKKESAL